MSDPISLRNIPPDTLRLAHALSTQTGLSLNAVLRLALASGILVELTKVPPDRRGRHGGLETRELARALRRHLGSAIDLLLEQGQHPYQGALGNANGEDATASSGRECLLETRGDALLFDRSLGEDLEALGIGQGISDALR
jgi:hypothetical protein